MFANRTSHIIKAVVLFLFVAANSVCAAPAADEINILAGNSKQIIDEFAQQSFELRIKYEYDNNSLTADEKRNLYQLAENAGNQLKLIAEEQQKLKKQIEDYQGSDWDEKYGSTNLWRNLSTQLYKTQLNKCHILFYLALTDKDSQKNKANELLAEINELEAIHNVANLQFIKAKTLALLAKSQPGYKPLAEKQFDLILASDNLPEPIFFRATFEKIKLADKTKLEQLDELTQKLSQSNCADNLELALSLAFLQLKYDDKAIEKTFRIWPQIESIPGSIILADLSSQLKDEQAANKILQTTSICKAELAAMAAWKNGAGNYRQMLDYFSKNRKFQTPLILYVTAVAFADSAPNKTVNLLLETSKLQQLQKNEKLNLTPAEIAEQATQLAYNLFNEEKINCSLAIEAFENYRTIANGKIDEKLEYFYTTILNSCGQTEKAEKLLQEIADSNCGNYNKTAKFELAIKASRQKQYDSPCQKALLLEQLANLITDGNDCKYTIEIMEFVSKIVETIEQVQADCTNFAGTIKNCKKLAEIYHNCCNSRQSSLMLTEINILTAQENQQELSKIQELLSSMEAPNSSEVNLIRCKARLSAEQGKFCKAAELWAELAQIHKTDSYATNQRSWKWWRAKFYELFYQAKCPQTQKTDILHTIEVIENSYTNIPQLWLEKLDTLKSQLNQEN
ncbi:MAG: hypothetical protein KAS69_01375 [Planctomycetes bacterium]|nr:hypothetical protein [Planctomycetota bacterium]